MILHQLFVIIMGLSKLFVIIVLFLMVSTFLNDRCEMFEVMSTINLCDDLKILKENNIVLIMVYTISESIHSFAHIFISVWIVFFLNQFFLISIFFNIYDDQLNSTQQLIDSGSPSNKCNFKLCGFHLIVRINKIDIIIYK